MADRALSTNFWQIWGLAPRSEVKKLIKGGKVNVDDAIVKIKALKWMKRWIYAAGAHRFLMCVMRTTRRINGQGSS